MNGLGTRCSSFSHSFFSFFVIAPFDIENKEKVRRRLKNENGHEGT